MSRTQKEKLETCTDIPIQLPEISTEESAVKAADGCNANSQEKRKKEADKPLYLRRV
jgi:hypothetical protein